MKQFFKFVFALLLTGSPLQAEIPNKSVGTVHDFANILDLQTESELNSLIAQVEQKTSAEIAVVTIPSLEGMTVEEYAVKLFKQWGIGKKEKNNGVLVLVVPNERKMRIEVGYGLEPILPDGLCGEIIREQFVPAFKERDFSKGIVAGVNRIAQIIEKGEPASQSSFGRQFPISHEMPWSLRIFMFLFLLPFVVIGASLSGGMVASFRTGKFSNATGMLFIALFWNGIVSIFEFLAGAKTVPKVDFEK